MMKLFVKLLFAVLGPGVQKKHLKKAINDANNLRLQTFKKQYVLLHKGEFVVVSKQRIKKLVHEGQFKKGVSVKDIEAGALYVTK